MKFNDIKHFIRHGKQAALRALDDDDTDVAMSDDMNNYTANLSGTPQQPQSQRNDCSAESSARRHHRRHQNVDMYSKLATDMVNEENEQRRLLLQKAAIERYQIRDKIGEGAFSVVYKALDSKTNDIVAIKLIKKYQMDKAQQASVLKEVTIMRQLNHPNIVKLLDFIETDEHYYIVQELVPGGEIFNEIVKYTYFSEDLSRHVILQVAEALKYLHESVGVVHRDLKPENIFFIPISITSSKVRKFRKSDDPYNKLDEGEFILNVGGGGVGTVKLGDFGLSKQIFSDKNSLKTPCGTIGYTAPEIVKDMKYSKEVDMWALGCVLYILLCGFPPFFDDKVDVLTRKVAAGHFEFLSPWWDEISPGAKNCVSKLLTVNPLERYTINDFMKDPWIVEFLVKSKNAKEFQEQQQELLSHQKSPASSRSSVSSAGTLSSIDSASAIPPRILQHKQAIYSPAAMAMREAFDISAAVHRMGEEAALLEYQQKRDNNKLAPLAEDSEISNDTNSAPALLSNDFDLESGASKPFELRLNGATILARRNKKKVLVSQ